MTNERIEEIRGLCEAATPGPWRTYGEKPEGKKGYYEVFSRQIVPELLDALAAEKKRAVKLKSEYDALNEFDNSQSKKLLDHCGELKAERDCLKAELKKWNEKTGDDYTCDVCPLRVVEDCYRICKSKESMAEFVLEQAALLAKTEAECGLLKEETKSKVAAQATLEHMRYTYRGGELWKPPLEKSLDPDLLYRIHSRMEDAEAMTASMRAENEEWLKALKEADVVSRAASERIKSEEARAAALERALKENCNICDVCAHAHDKPCGDCGICLQGENCYIETCDGCRDADYYNFKVDLARFAEAEK